MSDLIEKVTRAACRAADVHLTCSFPECACKQMPAAAKAAIATVLTEMLERFHVLGSDENDKVWKDTLRAFAAVHNIVIGEKDGCGIMRHWVANAPSVEPDASDREAG